jgi:hypothetical protein
MHTLQHLSAHARAHSLSFSRLRARARALYEHETRQLIHHLYPCSTIGSSASNYRPAAQDNSVCAQDANDDSLWMREQDRMIANMLG